MSPAYDPAQWSVYLAAEAGAAAALTGLIFVAVSINLSKIVISKPLVARSAKAICTLVGVLAATTFAPGAESTRGNFGCGAGDFGACDLDHCVVDAARRHCQGSLRHLEIAGFTHADAHIAALQFIAAGVSCYLGRGGGLYWLVGATLCSFLVALLDGWVLLIEIQR